MPTKREFLGMLGAAVVIAPAQIRILGGPRRPDEPDIEGQRCGELVKLIAGAKVGARKSHGGLHVFWLHGGPAAPLLPIENGCRTPSTGTGPATVNGHPTC